MTGDGVPKDSGGSPSHPHVAGLKPGQRCYIVAVTGLRLHQQRMADGTVGVTPEIVTGLLPLVLDPDVNPEPIAKMAAERAFPDAAGWVMRNVVAVEPDVPEQRFWDAPILEGLVKDGRPDVDAVEAKIVPKMAILGPTGHRIN